MMVSCAVFAPEHGEAPEGMAHLQLLAHPHAAMQLYRFLADVARGIADLDLRRRDGARSFARVALAVGPARREAGHRARLLERHDHVDDAMLQRLEGADRHAELLARLQI